VFSRSSLSGRGASPTQPVAVAIVSAAAIQVRFGEVFMA
jgi:hypothetical protein